MNLNQFTLKIGESAFFVKYLKKYLKKTKGPILLSNMTWLLIHRHNKIKNMKNYCLLFKSLAYHGITFLRLLCFELT